MATDRESELWDLYRGLAQQGYGGGSDPAPLVDTLRSVLSSLCRPWRRSFSGRPPRRVAGAMAAAIFAQPHLAWTWQGAQRDGTCEVMDAPALTPDPPLMLTPQQLETALGLSQWELDELREEIDRRAGMFHRQVRAIRWLRRRFDVDRDPQRLFGVLFPGASDAVGAVDFVQRGAQLYAVVDDGGASSPLALYLSWAAPPQQRATNPFRFRPELIDSAVLRALCRFSGEQPAALHQLLNRTIALVPRAEAADWLTADRWRSRGVAQLTSLGWPFGTTRALNEPLRRDEAEWDHWLMVQDGTVQVEGHPRAVFDALAIERVQEAMRQSYAALLAHLDQNGGASPTVADLALFDTDRHLRAVLTPLITWVSDPGSRDRVVRRLGASPSAVGEVLEQVQEAWTAQLNRSWIAPPDAHHTSLLGLLMPHLVTLSGSLRALLAAEPDPRAPHRDILQLFTSFYMSEAPLERLWIRGLSDTVSHDGRRLPEDVPGDWFWGTWQRVLDASTDAEAAK